MTADRDSRRGMSAIVAVLVAFVFGVAAFVGLAAPAGAQYIPGQPGIIIDPPELPTDGGSANVIGFGCPASSTVDAFLVVDGQEIPIGSSTAEDSEDGSFSIPVIIPPEAEGEYTVLAECDGLTLSTILTMTAPAAEPVSAESGTLPTTGSNSTSLVQVAALLIAAGGLGVLVSRKRRTSHSR